MPNQASPRMGCAPMQALDPRSPFAYESWRPTALLSLRAPDVRSAVRAALEGAGWVVIEQPTGFHVLQAIADVIEGGPVWRRPRLIVVDAWSPGCAGVSLAAGLQELGIAIPVLVIDPQTATDQIATLAVQAAIDVWTPTARHPKASASASHGAD